MKDLSSMSPVARARYLQRVNTALELEAGQAQDSLGQMAMQVYKLRQEVTGGLQVLWLLASKSPERKLTLPASELITAFGALKRSHDPDTDLYTFEAVEPTQEQIDKFNEQMNSAPIAEKPQILMPPEDAGVQ